MNDPEMFSSFYYLPVKSMGRHTMLLLCRLINLLNEFRNTLFLLKDLILRDIEKFNLLDLFYLRLREIKKQEKSDFPLISVLIGILKDYLQFKADSGIPPYTFDILIWEATQGLLKGNFLRWHLINPQDKKKEESGSGAKKEWRICPAPVWQLIKTDYNIPFVIPSFNGWEVDKRKISKGVFYFILVAVSEIKCKFIRIGEKEYHTLDSLMKLPSEEFTERISSMMDEKGLHKLVNKLFSTGIIEAVEKPDRKLF
jgi:hypothetical protein